MAGLQTAGTITKDSVPAHAHVVLPDSEDYDLARRAFNLTVDQRPAAVAFAHDEEEVSRIVRFAAERGLRLAPQRTGHNAGPLGALEDTVLLRTDRMRGVELDAATRRARVRAGARWGDVVPRASEVGLAALHGSTPDVSVVGYSLGGGLGWYGRKHGLASNSVTAIELVTADGELHRVDRDHEADLFWALRGGGGSFGVVTAMEFDLLPVAEIYAGALFFPIERSGEVLHAWHDWLDGVPDEVTSVGRILQFPPLPDIPEPLRGNAFALVEAVYLGSEADGAELLRPLRELGPAMDTFAMVPPAGISELHMDPRDPIPYAGDHMLVGALPEQAIDELVAVAGPGSGSPLLSFELRHTGGALARSEPGDGALSKLAGSFCMFGVGVTPDEGAAAALHAHFGLIRDTLAPYDAGSYLNFTEHPEDTARFFPRDVENRLRMIKGAVDPDEVFHANHPITPAPWAPGSRPQTS